MEEVPLRVAEGLTPETNMRAHRGAVQRALRELDEERRLAEARALLESKEEN